MKKKKVYQREIMKITLDFLKKNNVSLTPENYRLFYVYFLKDSLEVLKKVQSYLSDFPSFTQESLDTLYRESFDDSLVDDQIVAVDNIIRKINRELAAIIDKVHDSDKIADTIHVRLKEYSQLLRKEYTEEAIKTVISSLLHDIEEIRGTHYKLKKEFDTTAKQIESLTRDFEIAKKESMYDPLTGLYNRRVFEKRLKEEINRFRRYGAVFCISFIDIDDFKAINDRFTHASGDEMLKNIAASISENIRQSDIAARYGGDEFAIIFSHSDLEGALAASNKICQEIRQRSITVKGKKVKATVSIGVTVMKDDMDEEKIVSMADRAMYKVKKGVKNSVSQGLE